MKWMMPFICAIVSVTAPGTDLRAQGIRVLSSDLAALAVCKDRDPITLEDPFERFLRGQGFKVLNVARIQREHGHRPLLEVHMVGLDDKRRIVIFRMLPYPKEQIQRQDRYSVGFRTTPPTRHASEIEVALLDFFSNELRCEVRDVARSENGAEAADLYDQEVARVENMFREADKLNGLNRL
jgi:hypothetical protein